MQTLTSLPSGTTRLIDQVVAEFIAADRHFTSVHVTNEVKRRGGLGSHSEMQKYLVALFPAAFIGYQQVQITVVNPTDRSGVSCQGYFPDTCDQTDFAALEQTGWEDTLKPVGATTPIGAGTAQPIAAPAQAAIPARSRPKAAPKALPAAGQSGLGRHILDWDD